MRASVSPRQSASSLILASISGEGEAPPFPSFALVFVFFEVECAEEEATTESVECVSVQRLFLVVGHAENLHGSWVCEFREHLVHCLEFVLQPAFVSGVFDAHVPPVQAPDPLACRSTRKIVLAVSDRGEPIDRLPGSLTPVLEDIQEILGVTARVLVQPPGVLATPRKIGGPHGQL